MPIFWNRNWGCFAPVVLKKRAFDPKIVSWTLLKAASSLATWVFNCSAVPIVLVAIHSFTEVCGSKNDPVLRVSISLFEIEHLERVLHDDSGLSGLHGFLILTFPKHGTGPDYRRAVCAEGNQNRALFCISQSRHPQQGDLNPAQGIALGFAPASPSSSPERAPFSFSCPFVAIPFPPGLLPTGLRPPACAWMPGEKLGISAQPPLGLLIQPRL